MTSHRGPGLLTRWGLVRSRRVLIPVPRQQGVEVVDARTGLRHRVGQEAMLSSRLRGACTALCGAWVLVASLTDPGCATCRRCPW